VAATTFFISDLHLDAMRPAVTDLFLQFLREQVADAGALYILGDLFEIWIGDDDPDRACRTCPPRMSRSKPSLWWNEQGS